MALAAPAISPEKRELFALLVEAIRLVNEIWAVAKNPHAEEAKAVPQPRAMAGDTVMDYVWRGLDAVHSALLPHLREDKKAVTEKARTLKRQITAVRAKVLELPNNDTKRPLLKLGQHAGGLVGEIKTLASARRGTTMAMDVDMSQIVVLAEDIHQALSTMREKVLRMP
jgi:hypothetical protein